MEKLLGILNLKFKFGNSSQSLHLLNKTKFEWTFDNIRIEKIISVPIWAPILCVCVCVCGDFTSARC